MTKGRHGGGAVTGPGCEPGLGVSGTGPRYCWPFGHGILVFLALVTSTPLTTAAQVRPAVPAIRLDARYDNIEEGAVRERLQGALRLEQRVSFFQRFDLVFLVATGDRFSSRWVTFHDLRPGEDDTDPLRLNLRQAYLEIRRRSFRVQAGSVPPVKAVISPTGLDPAGWIDGMRFEWYNAPEGAVEFVVGRLGGVKTPSLFDRPSPFFRPGRVNYGEVEVSQQVRPWLRLEGSAEYLRAPYLRGEVRWMPTETAEVFTEVLYNLHSGAVNYGTTASADLVALASGWPPGRTTVELSHAYKGEGIGLRGELADDFVTFGHSLTATLTVVIAPELGLRGRVKGILAEPTGPERPGDDAYTRLKLEINWRLD